MRIERTLPIAMALIALACSSCAATRTQKSFGETVDDGAITARVKTALIGNSDTEARHINVDTRRGVVQLNGFVESQHERNEAVHVAQGATGVLSVEDNLEVRESSRTAGAVLDDSVITAKVKMALAESPATRAYEIKVATHNGTVQLGGWVDTNDMRAEAGRLAGAVTGVMAVANNLDIKK
jgi:hyperosmotically inducible protein